MNENLLTKPISRREMMKQTAITAGALALLPSLSACEGDMNVGALASQIRLGGTGSADMQAKQLELVRQASLAASGHNMQPWIFEIKENTIQILPDYSRRLPVVDAQDRELWMSLGCALENLVIAAGSMGIACDVKLLDNQEGILITLSDGGQVKDTALSAAIAQRQCNRGTYNMKFVQQAEMNALQSVSVLGSASAVTIRDGSDVKSMQALVMEGDVQQYADAAFVNELVDCLRFNEREALETRDGLFSACSGNPNVPRFIGKMFVKPGMGESQAEKDRQLIDSASGLLLIGTPSDTVDDWIWAGRLVQRVALQMTSLGIAHSFMNQPIELVELRTKVSAYLSDKSPHAVMPQLLLRYGYADEPIPYSLRRSLDEIVV